ncbi:MAG TPA: maltose alpha-D-glucosyltransferase [Polyangiaceae bacterium]|nr:maltose alpha-D-glucosyltransferase [Polyangiaceae bacterium]
MNDPLWYKDAIIYELHVRAFSDSSGDGIGDFNGLVDKLEYLHDLGITAIWLLPFYPSPLRDDGYDIADYGSIHPSYGTMTDFKRFLREAHRRGLRVITELVINHTSNEHPWFQRARRAPPGSKERDFYVWSDNSERYKDARIIFQDFERSNWTWDPVANAYYWHRFYSHQPDLNFENPAVQKAVFKALDYWMEMGVDGMRLDAVPYLFEREGTNCENLPETHAFLKKLRKHIDKNYKHRMLLAEANQWPEDAAAYFGDGDECHMNFHFPVMPRMFMALQLENSFPVLDILEQTPAIPESSQWAVFLRNHDELTLEMVTDEDRDYMYRMYATDPQARINLGIRRRLAPLLKERRKVEMMNGLLLSLPGTPVIYYGDEIGMGDNIYLGDRNGVRTPMQWSADLNAGFSRANPQQLYLPVIIDPEHHFQAVNVAAQQHNSDSLLWWMKRLIALRKQHQVFGRGDIRFLHPDNSKVLAFVRTYENERVLAVFNLSRFPQYVELDMSEYEGMTPRELLGRLRFPVIKSSPYLLMLGPHQFYWFGLEAPEAPVEMGVVPALHAGDDWKELFTNKNHPPGARALTSYMRHRRWFRSKAREIAGLRVDDILDLNGATFAVLTVDYVDAHSERYVVSLARLNGRDAKRLERNHGDAVIARLLPEGLIYEPLTAGELGEELLEGFTKRRTVKGLKGRLVWQPFGDKRDFQGQGLAPRAMGSDQSNTNVAYGERLLIKLFRKLEPGQNPDVELGRYLTARRFANAPEVVGVIEYQHGDERHVAAVAQRYVPNQGDAWALTNDELDRYFDRALMDPGELVVPTGRLFAAARGEAASQASKHIGTYAELAALLGTRTAELHLALGAASDDAAFAPEAFSQLYQRSIYQSARAVLRQTLILLTKQKRELKKSLQPLAKRVVDHRSELDTMLRRVVGPKMDALRIRVHGDYHLGQVLYTGKDFIIIDFEGEPTRSLGERRVKRSPLRDVAGMLRSFDYVATAALLGTSLRPEDVKALTPWAHAWTKWTSVRFLRSYLDVIGQTGLLPHDEDAATLLEFYLIEKCIYELAYELNNRPDWVKIPLRGLDQLLTKEEA